MKIDFLIPVKLESEDRIRNAITSVTYLLSKFAKSKVILKEVDNESIFQRYALPEIQKHVDTQNLLHIYEVSNNSLFHKTKVLNDLLIHSSSQIVYNYDVDVIIPSSSVENAYKLIQTNQCDVVYPFGCGVYQWAVNYSNLLMNEFFHKNFDLNILKSNSERKSSTIGWGQMIDRTAYLNSYMWNENFISWGAEDCEFYYKLNCLGYRVGRINDDIYHLEHSRTYNSHYNNPKFMDNHNLWQNIRRLSKNDLIKYYEVQPYVKKRRSELNVSV